MTMHPQAPIRAIFDATCAADAVARLATLDPDVRDEVRKHLANYLWWKVEGSNDQALATLKGHLERERAHSAEAHANGQTHRTDDGVLRWNSNGTALPDHAIVPLGVDDADALLDHIATARAESRAMLARYREQAAREGWQPDPETVMHGASEARTAGTDVTLVDVLTGARTTYRPDGTYEVAPLTLR